MVDVYYLHGFNRDKYSKLASLQLVKYIYNLNKYSFLCVNNELLWAFRKGKDTFMDISGSLVTALMLLGLGMAFVYMFLGLLFICINLMAKYIPADKPVITPQRKTAAAPKAVGQTQVSPQVVAAITSAVQQYRKSQAV